MNRLSTERRGQVIACLVEGMSIRSTVRVTGVAKNTIAKLLADLGEACSDYQDKRFRNLETTRVEVDEIWEFVYAKAKNVPIKYENEFGYGDVWTWVAIDADSKLVPTWLVGSRDSADCYTFLADLKQRLKHRIQLTSDGHAPYLRVIEPLFGADAVDFAQLIKMYGNESGVSSEHRYSPAECSGIEKRVITGMPDESLISTSYIERQNLTMRMGMRRFTRLTNAFSKKVENHAVAVSLHFMHYNFCRVHQTLTRKYGKKMTPAMAAGVADYPWSVTQLAGLLD
jgi:IS1 family transposase